MLFDLETDSQEFNDLGTDPAHAEVRARLSEAIFTWTRRHHNRTTISDAEIETFTGSEVLTGIRIGFWDQQEVDAAIAKGESGN